MLTLLFPLLTLALAGEISAVERSCGRMMISSIYAAEKSYEAERGRFSDSFREIGFEKIKDPGCHDWTIEIRLFNGATEFLATASHPKGIRFMINEKKQLKEE